MFKQRASSNTLPNLGELELQVLDVLWREPGLSAKDVHGRLGCGPGLNTLQSTLERLHSKALVRREKRSHAYYYNARLARAELASQLIATVIARLRLGSLEPVFSQFMDSGDGVDEGALDRLEAMIRERRQNRTADD